jgi:aminopeptidase N
VKKLIGLVVCLLTINSAWAAMPVRKNEDNLTEKFAQARKAQVKDVRYDLHFQFQKGVESYTGKAKLEVTLAQTTDPLSIDIKTNKIESVEINGAAVTDYKTLKGFIEIPAKHLKEKNTITIAYAGDFSKEGDGVQRVVDPEDKAEYIYTDFEPYQAHTLFPCFDQPDMKAGFHVTVEAPKDWTIIGNELIEKTTKSAQMATTEFKTTPRLSTYLFFLGAGDFIVWKDKFGQLPLELYARKSLKKYVDDKVIHETTKKGLQFFSEYFGTPYPFSKYGQIFVPEFAWGGMENPGAVTLNERNIFRGPPKKVDLENRNDLILHEMAHMWFGDLVTMSWWNDLWLNESFASYVATLAQARAMNSAATWLDFHSSKGWGYWQDQLSTTHPIETPVVDVRTGKGNFDGITYAKGAATLKQLHFFVGEAAFKTGLRNYFKTFAFKNASRADFMNAIDTASAESLDHFTRAWLRTAGPHRVKTKWTCEEKDGAKTISSFTITQSVNATKEYSPHRTRIAFFNKNPLRPIYDVRKILDVAYESPQKTVNEAIGIPCPDFVYPNYEDQDYALYSLDPVSLKNAEEVLKGMIEDPLTRLMVWNTLSQMVRDTELRISDYMNFVMAGIEVEQDPDILAILLGKHSNIRDNYLAYLTKEQRANFAPKIEKLIWQKVDATPPGNLRMIYFDFVASIATTQDSVTRLTSLLKGESKLEGVEMHQDRRWNIVEILSKANAPNIATIIEEESKRDATTAGQRWVLTAKTAIPTKEAKAEFWKMLEKPKDIPFSNLRSASSRFNDPDHPDLTQPYRQPFFKAVNNMKWDENDNLVEIYFENLFPQNICTIELLRTSKYYLGQSKNTTDLAKRSWKEANDELEKCVAVRRADQTPLKASP